MSNDALNETSQNLLSAAAVAEYLLLKDTVIEAVSARFSSKSADFIDAFGPQGMAAWKEDIGYTIDFLRPALEFGFVQPFIDYLVWLAELLEARGISAAHVTDMLDMLGDFYEISLTHENAVTVCSLLQKAKAGMLFKRRSSDSNIDENMPEPWPEHIEMMKVLLAGDTKAGRRIFDSKMAQGHSFLEAEVHLLQPALYEIGRQWQRNQVSVAQEHLATAAAMTLMAQAFTYVELKPSIEKKVLCACVAGNRHAVGLRIVADGFELNGWDVIFLGPDVPTPDLIKQVVLDRPNLVCLSVSMPDHLATAKEAITLLRTTLGTSVPAIMLGGLAVNAFSAIATVIGADSTAADAEKVCEVSVA